MKKNIIYCADTCPFCQSAYRLLENNNIAYQKKYVTSQNDWENLREKTGRDTIPQVFIKDVHIGGFDDLSAAKQSGKLDKILNG